MSAYTSRRRGPSVVTERDKAVKDIRKTLTEVKNAELYGEIRPFLEKLHSQVFYLRQWLDESQESSPRVVRWDQYAEAVQEEHSD